MLSATTSKVNRIEEPSAEPRFSSQNQGAPPKTASTSTQTTDIPLLHEVIDEPIPTEMRLGMVRNTLDSLPQNDRTRICYEALIRYYENGGRVPNVGEELWIIDGELSWGERRKQSDFPPGGFINHAILLEVSESWPDKSCIWC
jgi:hypothetical protein